VSILNNKLLSTLETTLVHVRPNVRMFPLLESVLVKKIGHMVKYQYLVRQDFRPYVLKTKPGCQSCLEQVQSKSRTSSPVNNQTLLTIQRPLFNLYLSNLAGISCLYLGQVQIWVKKKTNDTM